MLKGLETCDMATAFYVGLAKPDPGGHVVLVGSDSDLVRLARFGVIAIVLRFLVSPLHPYCMRSTDHLGRPQSLPRPPVFRRKSSQCIHDLPTSHTVDSTFALHDPHRGRPNRSPLFIICIPDDQPTSGIGLRRVKLKGFLEALEGALLVGRGGGGVADSEGRICGGEGRESTDRSHEPFFGVLPALVIFNVY